MLHSKENIDVYIQNYLIPLVKRYKDNPALWLIDLCNEPDWVHQNEECGRIPWERLIAFFAACTAAIHKHSDILVTVGNGVINNNGKVSDASMMSALNDPDACIDFYSPHYYPWMDIHFGIPFYTTPDQYHMVLDKPALIGECPAKGSTGHTLEEDFEAAYQNCWLGVMPWTSNGVDSNGSLEEMGSAVKAFRDKHSELVFIANPRHMMKDGDFFRSL